MVMLCMLLLDKREGLVHRAWFEHKKQILVHNAIEIKILVVGTVGLHQSPQAPNSGPLQLNVGWPVAVDVVGVQNDLTCLLADIVIL
jgi:hypothetical protein